MYTKNIHLHNEYKKITAISFNTSILFGHKTAFSLMPLVVDKKNKMTEHTSFAINIKIQKN